MSLADDFRARAKANAEGSNSLFEAADFDTSPRKQVMATIGQVNATIYTALADKLEQSGSSAGAADPMLALRKSIIEKNNAVRKAAAYGYSTGDWSNFDKLTSTDGTEPGGTG